MDSIVSPVKKYIKKRDPAVIDNFAFKLHYRGTFVVLMVCMMLVRKYLFQFENSIKCINMKVSAKQFIGNPISCLADGVPGGTLDLYCWIHSTFSVPSRLKDKMLLFFVQAEGVHCPWVLQAECSGHY